MKIFEIILDIIILLTFILVGTPIKYNCIGLNMIIILIGTIYIIYKIFRRKEKIINKKIDSIMLFFLLSPIIPLIFKSYSSLEETLISIIKYISLFNIYILLKDIFVKDEIRILNILIGGGTALALLGIDEMTSKTLMQHVDLLDLPFVINYENRMFSTLGYANSFAIIMAITLLLSISKCQPKKEIYSGFTFLFLSALLLSYSRSVLVLFIIIFITYIFLLKDKIKTYMLYVITTNLIISLIYIKIFEACLPKEHYILIWLTTIVIFVLSIFVAKLITKKYDVISKITRRTYIKIFMLITISIGSACFIGLKLDTPLKIFLHREENNEVRYNIYNIIPNQNYIFTFNIEAKSKLNNVENYSIKIIEENKYYDTVKVHEIKFNNFLGTRTIEFTADEETHSVALLFNNNIKIAQQGLTVNSLYINGEKYILDYLYLPVQLVKRIENFTLENKSLWERITFFQDGLKIARENFFTGTGGRGWLYNYEDVQSYSYESTEIHNYFLQCLIENGIFSALAWMVLVIYSLINIIKRWKKKQIKITDFLFILLTAHSLVDFDMSFYCIMVIWIILFVSVTKENKNNIETRLESKSNLEIKLNSLIFISLIVLNIVIIVLSIYIFKLKQYNTYILNYLETTKSSESNNDVIELIKKYTLTEKSKKFYNLLKNLNYQNISTENMDYIYCDLKGQKIIANTVSNMERNFVIKQILQTNKDEEILKKFSSIIIDENEQMINNIYDKGKNRLTESEIKEYLELQQEIYMLALEKLNKE